MNIQEKTDVIKASPAIHVQGNVTHLQRRLWNVLLANAYDELLTRDVHEISVTDLIDKLEYASHNRNYLLEFFEALVDCKLKWNLLNKDEEWEAGIAVLLSSVVIRENGVCTYDFPSQLRPQLYNPRMYAKINLRLQNKFKSKYALILWEICLDYFDESRNEGETPFISLETFKELMGFSENEYQSFKILNRDVIKAAIKEINAVSGFHVEAEYQRKSRRVVAVKFRIKKLKLIPANDTKQKNLFPEDTDMEGIALELYQAGMSRSEALRVFNQGWRYVDVGKRPEGVEFDDYVREKIHLLKTTENVKNKGAFLRTALKENYTDEKINRGYGGKKRRETQEKIDKVEKQKQAVQEEWADKIGEITAQIIGENPDIIQNVSADLLHQQESGLYLYYKHSESAEENYKRTPIAVQVNVEIRKRHADRYAATEKEYSGKINKVEAEIDKLKASLRK